MQKQIDRDLQIVLILIKWTTNVTQVLSKDGKLCNSHKFYLLLFKLILANNSLRHLQDNTNHRSRYYVVNV